jgi:hypothetical protein
MGTCGVKKRISCAIGLTLISDLLDTWIDLDFLFIFSIVCCLGFLVALEQWCVCDVIDRRRKGVGNKCDLTLITIK